MCLISKVKELRDKYAIGRLNEAKDIIEKGARIRKFSNQIKLLYFYVKLGYNTDSNY